jgi:hypothetical protein
MNSDGKGMTHDFFDAELTHIGNSLTDDKTSPLGGMANAQTGQAA